MKIEPYSSLHRAGCLAVFDSNIDLYFADYERDEFVYFLDHETDALPYFVILDGSVVVACGGYCRKAESVSLTWGMVTRTLHGQGLGTRLTTYRLDRIATEYAGVPLTIETSQHSMGFYARAGLTVVEHIKDGYEPGLDRVLMRRDTLERL